MPAHHTPPSDTHFEQRIIIHQLLRDDHTERWTPNSYNASFPTSNPRSLPRRSPSWKPPGVAWRLDDYVGASRCARYLFSLDLIGI